MARRCWHLIHEEDGALTLARRLPVRFDLAVEGLLPEAPRARSPPRPRAPASHPARARSAPPGQSRADPARHATDPAAADAPPGRFARATAEARIAALFEDPARVARWTGSGR